MSDVIRAARPASLPPAGDRFVVVEASAGTGKTFFLEHRVVDLVLAGAELGQILVVTFTDKSVAELRLRIRDLLDRLARQDAPTADDDVDDAWLLDDAARTRLRDAVTAFDHAPIFTIHGFCYRVLVEDAFAAQRLFQQTQVADEVAFDRAFVALLRERFATTSPDRDLLSAYLSRGDTVDKLRALLLACARKDAPPRAAYTAEHALALGEQLRMCFATADARDALLLRMNLSGNDKRHAPNWVQLIGRAAAEWDGAAAGVFALCDAIRKTGSTEPGPQLLKRVAKIAALAPVAQLLRAAIALTSLDEAIAAVMLGPVLDRIARDKAETGMFDYGDMLRLVHDALARGPYGDELAARLRARTPWVMIDEFQDTDPVQWNIFRSVWMHDAARGLTIVGDPKQAIYGFRGADVTTYERARDELARTGATRVDLDVNRRSTPAMVDAVNRLLAADGVTPLLDHSIRYDHPVSATTDLAAGETGAPIVVWKLAGAGRREEARVALGQAIGAELERLRADPPVWTARGREHRWTLGDCMVLTRTNSDSAGVAAALRARGIACALVESDKLFATREAHELRAVLAAIAAPRDRSARMRALRTRFFDVPWPDLMRVVDAPDHHVLIARLFDWAALAGRRAYEALFRRLVEDSRFAERALVLGAGERALVNTWHLLELLLEEVSRSRCDLHELVAQLGRWIADGDELPDDRDVQRAETDVDAVRILTVHKAKGLEAPFVFLYGAASPPPSSNVHALHDATGRALVVGPQDDAIEHALAAEVDAENQRLAYVALTRAKIRMYLPRYPDDAVDKRSMYWQIQRCLAPIADRVASGADRAASTVASAPQLRVVRAEPPPSVAAASGWPQLRIVRSGEAPDFASADVAGAKAGANRTAADVDDASAKAGANRTAAGADDASANRAVTDANGAITAKAAVNRTAADAAGTSAAGPGANAGANRTAADAASASVAATGAKAGANRIVTDDANAKAGANRIAADAASTSVTGPDANAGANRTGADDASAKAGANRTAADAAGTSAAGPGANAAANRTAADGITKAGVSRTGAAADGASADATGANRTGDAADGVSAAAAGVNRTIPGIDSAGAQAGDSATAAGSGAKASANRTIASIESSGAKARGNRTAAGLGAKAGANRAATDADGASLLSMLGEAVAAERDLVEVRAVTMGAPPAPPAPADALAGFDPPAPPVPRTLAPLEGARAGLAMLSYTRLGSELAAAAIEVGELPLALDPAEFDLEPEAPTELAERAPLPADELPPGADTGLFLHDLFELADLAGVRTAPDADAWAARPGVAELLAGCARARGISPAHFAHAARLVHGTLARPLEVVGRAALPPLAEATALAREVEFAYPIPGGRGLVKGYIDALVAWDDELWVVDYKSDLLAGDPAHVALDHVHAHYAIQHRLYGIAADRLRGRRRLGGMLFVFVRHGTSVALPITDDLLGEWTAWLAGLRTEAS